MTNEISKLTERVAEKLRGLFIKHNFPQAVSTHYYETDDGDGTISIDGTDFELQVYATKYRPYIDILVWSGNAPDRNRVTLKSKICEVGILAEFMRHYSEWYFYEASDEEPDKNELTDNIEEITTEAKRVFGDGVLVVIEPPDMPGAYPAVSFSTNLSCDEASIAFNAMLDWFEGRSISATPVLNFV